MKEALIKEFQDSLAQTEADVRIVSRLMEIARQEKDYDSMSQYIRWYKDDVDKVKCCRLLLEGFGIKMDRKKAETKKSKRLDVERAREYPIERLIDFRNNKTRCIVHDEKTPSMHYYKNENRVYCFGCGWFGDAISVCMKVKGVGFKDAVLRLL